MKQMQIILRIMSIFCYWIKFHIANINYYKIAKITFKTYTTYANNLIGIASPKTRAFVKRI